MYLNIFLTYGWLRSGQWKEFHNSIVIIVVFSDCESDGKCCGLARIWNNWSHVWIHWVGLPFKIVNRELVINWSLRGLVMPSVHWLLFLIDTNCQQEMMKRWMTNYWAKLRNALTSLLYISNKEYIGNSQGNAEMVYFVLTNDQ